jgi:hypothetical protein
VPTDPDIEFRCHHCGSRVIVPEVTSATDPSAATSPSEATSRVRNDGLLERCPSCGGMLAALGAVDWTQPAVEWHPNPELRASSVTFRVAALPGMLVAMLYRPVQVFRCFHWDGGIARPLIYAMLAGGIPAAALYVIAALRSGFPPQEVVSLPWLLAALTIVAPAWVYFEAQAAHLVLVLRGRARRPFAATLRAFAYGGSSVAWVLLVPGVGLGLWLAGSTAVVAIALREAHGLRPVVALTATLTPLALLGLAILARLLLEWMFAPQ